MATDTSGEPGLLSEAHRKAFAALADEMIPAAPGMPSASQAGAHLSGLDSVLGSRPDLLEPLRNALAELAGEAELGSALTVIRSPGHEDAWGVLGMVVAGAYFLNPSVRAALGYPGQQALAVDQLADDLDPELLAGARRRGPVYRPTPSP